MSALNHLLVGCDEIRSAWRGVLKGLTNIIDSLEDNDMCHACLRDDITIETRKPAGPAPLTQYAVAPDTGVEHAHPHACHCEAPGELVGPSMVLVGRRTRPVCNGVPEGYNRRCLLGRHNFDTSQ